MLTQTEIQDHGIALADRLRGDRRFRTERSLLLSRQPGQSAEDVVRTVLQLLTIRAGDADPQDLETLWPEDLIALAHEANARALREELGW